jgi:CheY-like chemotaxis protein
MQPGQDNGSSTRSPLSVLVVDGDVQRSKLLTQWLQSFCLVAAASTVREAAAMISRWTPDLMITDLDLPDMPGIEFIERLAQMPVTRHILFMVVTRRRGVRDKIDALRVGADEYLIWPCGQELLIQRVKLLSRFRRLL